MKTEDVKRQVFDVLVTEAGAPESLRDQFMYHWPKCIEFRFQGALGFGGKIWHNDHRVYVSCYREDETPEILAVIDSTNARLAAIHLGDSNG